MPTALLGAIECRRCGGSSTPGSDCRRCSAAWLPAASGSAVESANTAMVGVVPAGALLRLGTLLIDAALVGAAGSVVFVTLSAGPPPVPVVTALIAVAVLHAGQVALLARRGRTAGRLLTGLRTVDDLTGCAPGWRRLIASLARRSVRLVDLDIRRGGDPSTGRRPLDRRSLRPDIAPRQDDAPQQNNAPQQNKGTAAGSTVAASRGPRPTRSFGSSSRLVGSADRRAATRAADAPDAMPDAVPDGAADPAPELAEQGTASALGAVDDPTGRPCVGIVLDTGERYEIRDALLLGRSPVDPAGAGRPLLAWPDLTRRLAKTHVLLEWSGTVLWVTDLDTAGGTTLVTADSGRQLLVPGVRAAATVGCTVDCGGRSVKVVTAGV